MSLPFDYPAPECRIRSLMHTHSDGVAERRNYLIPLPLMTWRSVPAWTALGGPSSAVLAHGQQLMALTANPPCEVSLYFDSMSRPVSRMVRMTWSRLTKCEPSPCSARRAALIAFTEASAVRSMQGICTRPAIGSQVRPRSCARAISAAFPTWPLLPPNVAARPDAAMAQAEPTSPWQQTSAPEIEAFLLISEPTAAAASMKISMPCAVAPATKRS